MQPGETSEIRVTVDLRGKKGPVTKTVKVYTNDPVHPMTTLTVKMQVKDPLHLSAHAAAEIFRGSCRGCHVDAGKGKKGWELFKADCFMCHNAGKNTNLSTMSKKSRHELGKWIREGVENSSMPGFGKKFGGPLDDAEIESLIETIKQ